jgi:hypothetical protein
MHKRSGVILLFVWIFIGSCSNANCQVWTKKQLIHDLQFLNEAVKEGHPAFRNFGFSLDEQIRLINNSGIEKYSPFEYEYEIRKGLRSLQCCHTYITESPLKVNFSNKKNPFFPFRMLAEGDDLYLTSSINDSVQCSNFPVKVLKINDKSSKDILDYFNNYQSADGIQTTFRNYIVKNSASIIVRRIFAEADSFQIVGIVGSDTININERAFLTASEPVKSSVKDTIKVLFKNKESYFYFSEKLPKTGILKLKTFSSHGYSKFYRNIFKYQKQHQLKNILIDVRDNFGGSRNNVVELLSYFVKTEENYSLEISKSKINKHLKKSFSLLRFFYFDIFNHHKLQKTDSTRKYIFKIEPNKTNFEGKTIVWTNGASLSSASTLASYLQQKCNATVVGEETGGGVYGNNGGSFPTLELPESKIKIQFPIYRLVHNFGNQQENRGIKPDFPIKNSINNLLKNNKNDLLFIQSILIN